ncbi:MAG: pseudouridine synthase [Fimbriimonas sp.]
MPRKQAPKLPLQKRAKDFNADRIRARKENKAKEVAHSKDMAQRMGVAPAKKADVQDGERLHVRIAHAGICSRRAAEKLILEGRVAVNGNIVMDMGVKVSPEDEVRVDGQPIATPKTYTVVLYKPLGVVTTMSDPQGRPTIVRYLPDYGVPLKPVGRLDMDTEGLLICTNDGELAHRLGHPSYGIEKEYQALVKGIIDEKALKDLRKGVFIEGRRTLPAKVEVIHSEPKAGTTSLRITIHEGRKRQVRMMCDAVGHPIISLKRFRIGPLFLKGMRAGEAKLLGNQDVNKLRAEVKLDPI